MSLNSTSIFTAILVFLGSVIAFILRLFENKQSKETIEQDSQTQLQQSEQEVNQILETNPYIF